MSQIPGIEFYEREDAVALKKRPYVRANEAARKEYDAEMKAKGCVRCYINLPHGKRGFIYERE